MLQYTLFTSMEGLLTVIPSTIISIVFGCVVLTLISLHVL